MAIYRLIGYSLSVAERAKAALQYMLHVTASANDRLMWALSVVNLVILPPSSPHRVIGVAIDIDKGDGALSPVFGSELSGDVSISGSVENFGVREMSFSRFGADQVPTKSSFLRGMRRAVMTGYRGVPGAVGSRSIFDGYFRDTSYEGFPRRARIVCQDASLPFVTKPFYFTLAAGSERTRESIFLEAMAAHGVPLGAVELVNGGGVVRKPISEAGDRTVTQWAKEFLEPTGCRPFWQPDGKMHVRRLDMSRAPVRTFNAGDFRRVSAAPPSTNAPNQVKLSASVFSFDGPTGVHTLPPDVKEVRGTYAPLTAVLRQNIDGTTTVISAPIAAEDRVISKVVTLTTMDGGTVVSQVITEYGWFAPLACAKRQNTSTGAFDFNNSFPVFQFADGTWRKTQQEDFQMIRQRSLARNFDDDGNLSSELVTVYEYAPVEIPLRTVNPFTSVETYLDVFVTDDGHAWNGGYETLLSEANTTTFTVDNQLRIAQQQTDIVPLLMNEYLPTAVFFGSPYSGATVYVFGPLNSKRYAMLALPAGSHNRIAYLSQTNTPIDERTHRETIGYRDLGYIPRSFQDASLATIGTSRSTVVAGGIPYLPQNTGKTGAQATTVTVNDLVRQALSLGAILPEFLQNEFCESDGEERVVTLERLRDICAPRFMMEHSIDWVTTEGETIVLDHPDFGELTLLVNNWSASYTGATGANSQQTTLRWYPPELS